MEGNGHSRDGRRITLSLSETHPDGSILFQSWSVCLCTLDLLRAELGSPEAETYATREQVIATGMAVKQVPGVIRIAEEY